MNAGAYGGEMAQVVSQVEGFDMTGKPFSYTREEMDFGHRHTRLMDENKLITHVTFQLQPGKREELLAEMRAAAKKKDVSLVILMLTDVLLEGSQLLYVGDDDVISQAFGVTPRDNEVFLPKVMSRKKQIIPSLSALWG